MIDYRTIWESINNESKKNPLQSQIARRIPSNGLFPVFLATDVKKDIRLLYINIANIQSIEIEKLPRFGGLDISLVNASIGEFDKEMFIKFTQLIPQIDNIFELVISDICDKVLQVKADLEVTLFRLLSEWKIFFEKKENKILSIEAQKGLAGELYFLRKYLFKKYSYAESLSYWTGTERTNHDFQILNRAIEIKSTSSKQHKKFIVASERQLDSSGLDNLYLSLFTFTLHSNMPSCTLPGLINELYSDIEGDSIATFHLQMKLIKYGFNEQDAEKYKLGLSVSSIKFFEIKEGFPRLLPLNLPEGIGDLKYSVVVSACAPFEIATDILNHI